jgi:hypothetical protein
VALAYEYVAAPVAPVVTVVVAPAFGPLTSLSVTTAPFTGEPALCTDAVSV